MKRIAFYAHYDGKDEVKRYVLFALERLRELCNEVVFVSTSRLRESELNKIRPYTTSTLFRENAGFDFSMWKDALAFIDTSAVDELILTNSSILGPLYPLLPIFERMGNDPCDFWGMTDTYQICWHIQSYFLVFKKSAIQSPVFRQFFDTVLPFRDKFQTIRSYEVALAPYLEENGLKSATFVPMGSLFGSEIRAARIQRKRENATLSYPVALLKAGMPYVKIHLLRDNPGRVPLKPVLHAMRSAAYDMSLVEFDTPAEHEFGLLERLKETFSSRDDRFEEEYKRRKLVRRE